MKLKHSVAMNRFLPCLLLLAACGQQPAAPDLPTGTFAGAGRDRLCIEGGPGNYRAGLIAYGKGDNNCSASGRLEVDGGTLALVPRGEGKCRIELLVTAGEVRIGSVPDSCSYYCGPGARLAGQSFAPARAVGPAEDLAGSPLC